MEVFPEKKRNSCCNDGKLAKLVLGNATEYGTRRGGELDAASAYQIAGVRA